MDLLKLINEEAASGAVGTGAVAGHAMPLFTSLVKRQILNTNTKPAKIKYSNKNKKKTYLDLKNTFESVNNDRSEVISKLQALERKNSTSYIHTTSFGLQDEKGNIIKITVPNEEAEEFERVLRAILADEEADQKNIDVAEILWNLKDRFNIINVDWPEVEEDEEQDQTVQSDQQTPPTPEEGEADEISNLLGADENSQQSPEETPGTKDLLQQVIDMMKADAEARKKEAEAREKEAQAEIEELSMKQAVAKVKQEEMFLDMEEYNKAKKAKEQEAKRLAKLAKWKHDMAKEQGLEDTPEADLPMPSEMDSTEVEEITLSKPDTAEDEEFSSETLKTKTNKATADEIADFIVRRFK
jgi:hypothetical protein